MSINEQVNKIFDDLANANISDNEARQLVIDLILASKQPQE
jgi:polyhydroxyalkanoate synthesis regulator phasin